jgi:hypothetical protein
MMKLVLKGKKLQEMSGVENAHQFSLRAKMSYPTVEKYINRPEKIVQFDATVMAQVLTEGLGLTVDQAKELRLGDIFDFVVVEQGGD